MEFSDKNLALDNFHGIHRVNKVHWFNPPLEDIKMIESESESFVESKNSDIWEIEKLISQNKFDETANKLRQLESHLTASSTKVTKLKREIESEKDEKSELLSKQKKQEQEVKNLKRQLIVAQELKSTISKNLNENLDVTYLEKQRYDDLLALLQENTGDCKIATSNLSNEESKTSNMMESLKQNEKECLEFNNCLKEVKNNLDLLKQSLLEERKLHESRETELMQLTVQNLALQDMVTLKEMEKADLMKRKLSEMGNNKNIFNLQVTLSSFIQNETQRDLDVEYAKIQQLEKNLEKMRNGFFKINVDNSELKEKNHKLHLEITANAKMILELEARLQNLKFHLRQKLEQKAHEEEIMKLNKELSSVLEKVAVGEKEIKFYVEQYDDDFGLSTSSDCRATSVKRWKKNKKRF